MGIEDIFRAEHGRILATLIRRLGDFDVAEEALQEAYAAALEQWPGEGAPRIRGRGWSPRRGTRPSIGCAGAPGSRRCRTRSRITSS